MITGWCRDCVGTASNYNSAVPLKQNNTDIRGIHSVIEPYVDIKLQPAEALQSLRHDGLCR